MKILQTEIGKAYANVVGKTKEGTPVFYIECALCTSRKI